MTELGDARIGALGAMSGGMLLLLGNLIHPREAGQLDDVETLLEVVAGSGAWATVHTVLLLGVVLLLAGYAGILATLRESPWSRLGWGLAIAGTGLAASFMLTEAVALPPIAEVWSASSVEARQLTIAAALPLFHLSLTLSAGGALFLFGLTPLVMGRALLASDRYPSWLGRAGLAIGIVGVGANLYQVVTGVTTGTGLILVPAAIVAATVWIIVLGVLSWRGATEPRAMVESAASSP